MRLVKIDNALLGRETAYVLLHFGSACVTLRSSRRTAGSVGLTRVCLVGGLKMRGIIAVGGQATRIRPALDKTQQIVYDKPVLYYLLTNVMKAGIRDVMIVCNEKNIS